MSTPTIVEQHERTSESIHTFEFVRVSRPNFLRVKHGVLKRPLVEAPGLRRKISVLQKGWGDVKASRAEDSVKEPSLKTYPTEDIETNRGGCSAGAVKRTKAAAGARAQQPPQAGPTGMVAQERTTSAAGGTAPDVVLFFIHGVGGSLDVWRGQLDFFSQRGYETIALDLLGHGNSSAPKIAAAYTFYALSKEVTRIFKKYARRTNILIGHSYG